MNTRGVSLLSAGSWVRAVSKNKGSKRRGVSVVRPGGLALFKYSPTDFAVRPRRATSAASAPGNRVRQRRCLARATRKNKRVMTGSRQEMAVLQQSVPHDLDFQKSSGLEAVLQSAIRKAALRFVPLRTIAYRTSLGLAALAMNQQLGVEPVCAALAGASSIWRPRAFLVERAWWCRSYPVRLRSR